MTEDELGVPVVFCDNCGARKETKFCSECGQNSRNYNSSLIGIVRSVIGETFEIDSRIVQTVKALFTQPGQLSVEFTRNRRASYSSPIRLYLVSSILYFFVVSLIAAIPTRENTQDEFMATNVGIEEDQSQFDVQEIQSVLEKFETALDQESYRKLKEIMNRPDGSPSKLAVYSLLSRFKEAEISNFTLMLLESALNIAHSPDIALEQFLENLPFSMLVLLPWLAIVLKLLYCTTGVPFSHHLVFAMHTVSYGFIVLTIWALLTKSIQALQLEIDTYLHIAFEIYLFAYGLVALKTVYRQGWWFSVAKLLGIIVLFSLMLGPAIAFVAVITFFQF